MDKNYLRCLVSRRSDAQPKRSVKMIGFTALMVAMCGLNAGLAGAQGSSVMTVVDTFTPSTVTAGQETVYRIQLSNSGSTPLTNTTVPLDLGNYATQIISASSDCGGSFVQQSPTQGQWTGMTMAAAPSAVQATICNVSFVVKTTTTSGTYQATYPASRITTDQGITNPNGSASTLTITPLQKLRVAANVVEKDFLSRSFMSFGNRNFLAIIVTNPNPATTAAIQGISFNTKTFFDLGQIRPDISKCNIGGTPTGDRISSSATVSGRSVSIANFTIQGGESCTLYVETVPNNSPFAYMSSAYRNQGTASRIDPLSQADYITLSASTNTTDPALNSSAQSGYTSFSAAIGLGKSFNDSKAYNPNYQQEKVYLELGVKNTSDSEMAVGFTDQLPASMTLDGTIEIMPNSSSSCTTSGITVAADGKSLVFSGVKIPPAPLGTALAVNNTVSTCSYRFGMSKAEAGTNTVRLGGLSATNAYTSFTAPASDTTAVVSADIAPLPGQIVDKQGGFASTGKWASYKIRFQNNSATPMASIEFTDSWTHQLLISTQAAPETTCGGTIEVNPDRKGFRFQNGNLAGASSPSSSSSCTITIWIDPKSTLAGRISGQTRYFNNTTDSISFSRSGISQTVGGVSGTLAYSDLAVKVSTEISRLLVGRKGYAYTYYTNGTSTPVTTKLTIPLGNLVEYDASAPAYKQCGVTNFYSAQQNLASVQKVLLAPSEYSYNPSTREFTVFNENPDVSLQDTTSASDYVCRYSFPIQAGGSTGEEIRQLKSITEADTGIAVALPASANALRYQVTPENTYTINKTFSPQTITAGATTNLSFSLQSQSGPTDTVSPQYGEIIDNLPEGMEVALTKYTPNQADGSYKSPDLIPQAYVAVYPYSSALPCTEISADRKTIISRCRVTSYSSTGSDGVFPILITRYGDLINTIPVENVKPFYGSVIGPASASAKATRGIGITKLFSPTTIVHGGITRLSFTLHNATVTGEGPNVLNFTDSLPSNLIPNTSNLTNNKPASGPLAVSGDCQNATATYDSATHRIAFANITMLPQTSCTVSVDMRGINSGTYNTSAYNYIGVAQVSSTSGASNPISTSASVVITAAKQCLVASNLTTAPTLSKGITTPLTYTLTNTGEANLTVINNVLSSSTSNATYEYQVGDAVKSASLSQAWANFRTKHPEGVLKGQSVTVTVYVTPLATAMPDSPINVSITSTPGEGVSCGSTSGNVSAVVASVPAPTLLKEQKVCQADTCDQTPYTTAQLNAKPCELVSYRITATGKVAALSSARLSDTLPVGLELRQANATSSSGQPLYWSTTTQPTPSTSVPTQLKALERIEVFADKDGSGTLTAADTLAVDETLVLNLITQVAGRSCSTTP